MTNALAILSSHGHDLSGVTANRPKGADIGEYFFDTTLNMPVFWNGTSWVGLAASPSGPPQYGNGQLWLDVFDVSTFAFRLVAFFRNITTTGQLLGVPTNVKDIDLSVNNKFSIAGWVYFGDVPGDAFGANNTIWGITSQAETAGAYWLRLGGSAGKARLQFCQFTGASSSNEIVTAAGPASGAFSAGQWYHIAQVFNGAGGSTDALKLQLYVNGVLIALASPSGTTLQSTMYHPTASGSVYIHLNGGFVSNQNANNRMSDIGLWDGIALTQQDVTNLYAKGAGCTFKTLPGIAANPISAGSQYLASPTAFWPLDEESGTRADVTGNGFNLPYQTTDGSMVKCKSQVKSWTDKSGVLGAPSSRARRTCPRCFFKPNASARRRMSRTPSGPACPAWSSISTTGYITA